MNSRARRSLLGVRYGAPLAICSFLVGGPGHAVDSTYLLNVGVGRSDNITLTENDKTSETIASAGLDLSLSKRTRRLETEVDVDASYVEYLDDTYDREVVGTAEANLDFAIVPEYLSWYLQDDFGQTTAERLAPNTPDNREYINRLGTGPVLSVRLGTSNSLELSADYSRVDYEDSPFDSESKGGTLTLTHLLSDASLVSARVRHAALEFKQQPEAADYDRSEATLSYRVDAARTRFMVEGGGVEIEGGTSETQSGTSLRLRVTRILSTASTIELAGGRDIGDAGEMFAQQLDIAPTVGTEAITPAADPVTTKYARLSWNFYQRRTGLSLGVARFEDQYERQTELNRDRTEYEARFLRTLSGRTDVYAAAGHRKEELTGVSNGFNESSGLVRLTTQLGRSLSIGLEYQHQRRNFDQSANDDYRENRIWLRLFYGTREDAAEQFAPAY